MQADVAIVGAGPIGLATAQAAVCAGADTVVLERRARGSVSSCCTGLISTRTLPALGASTGSVLREIRAISIHLPSGRIISLRSDQVKAVTICRRSLEAELLENAREVGAQVRFSTDVVGAEVGKLRTQSEQKSERIDTSMIVGADGPKSQVAKWLGLGRIPAFAAASQVEASMEGSLPDEVAVFIGQNVAPGFFGWSVPAEEGVRRIGVGVLPPHSPTSFLKNLLAKRFPTALIRSQTAGWIPLAPADRSAGAGALLVGDAAGHVKPLSGGGLFAGAACARIAGETAAKIAVSDSGTDRLLDEYPRRCLDIIGKEQAFGLTVRHHLSRLQDQDIETAAQALDDPLLLQFLADHADIDHFHRLPDLLASEPSFWTTLLRLIPLLGRSSG